MEDKRTICEALIFGKWYLIKVCNLLGHSDVLRRCPECKAQIKLMQKGRDGQKEHFEHYTRNSSCSESIAFGNHEEYGENKHIYINPSQKEIDESYEHKALLEFVVRSKIQIRSFNEKEELHKKARAINTNGVTPAGQKKPTKMSGTISNFVRDAAVVSFVLNQSNGVCEMCETKAPFTTKSGDPYLEVHHVINLADGGADTVDNTVAVCPNCHKELHYGVRSPDLTKLIYNKVSRLIAI